MAQDNNNNINTSNNSDDLYKVSAEDKQAGLRAIEPLPGSLNLVIVRFDKTPIKVDISKEDWPAKLKTECNDCDIGEEALSAAKKRLHLIEAEKLLEIAHQNEVQRNKDVVDRAASKSLGSAMTDYNTISGNSLSLSPLKETNSQKLIGLIEGMNHEFFLDQHGRAFIITKNSKGNVNEPIELLDEDFVEYALGIFWDAFGEVIHRPDVKDAASILAYKAKRNIDPNTGETITRPLYVRVAWQNPTKRDIIYIDVADSKRHIIIIKKGEGFRVVTQNDVEPVFRRHNRMSLPLPSKEEVDENVFDEFLDLYQMVPRGENHAKRVIAKAMMGMRMVPGIPHPIELPYGSKGGLKSSWVEAQKRMIDPSVGITQTLPQNEDDFSLQGYHNYVLVYDNIKRKNVPKWFPDALSRYVYEQAAEKRQHYSNTKTIAFGASGCAIVAGINKMFEEEDLLDRCVTSEWRRLKKGKYLPKQEAERRFQEIQPKLLAYLCQKTAKALELYDQVSEELKDSLGRMADFTIWGECFARACGHKKYEFVKAYENNLDMQNVEIVQNNLPGKVLVSLVHHRFNEIQKKRRNYGTLVEIRYNKSVGKNAVIVFEGSINALAKEMDLRASQMPFNIDINKAHDWPRSTNKKSQAIRLIQSNLSEGFGIDIDMFADTTGTLTGHRNRMFVRITKDPSVAPADDPDSEDRPSNNNSNSSSNGGKGSKNDKGKSSLSSGEGESASGNNSKVFSNQPLHALHTLQNHAHGPQGSTLEDRQNPSNQSTPLRENCSEIASFDERSSSQEEIVGKDCKACKDTFVKTFHSEPEDLLRGKLHHVIYQASQVVLQELPQGLDKPSPLPSLTAAFEKCVAFDPEWNPETDEWYEAGFTDTQRNRVVLHIADFGSEKALIQAIVDKLNSYKNGIVLGWWSRGKLKFAKHYSENKMRRKRGDLIRLHEKCVKYGIESPISLSSSYDNWPALNNGTIMIDLHSVFDLPLVRDTIFHRKYQSTKLDEVYTALYPDDPLGGKLEGIVSGDQVAKVFNGDIEVQRAYVQRDADMTLRLAEVSGGQLLGTFLEIAKEINLPFEEVCHSSLTKWWKRIFDNMGYTNPYKDPATGEPYFWKAANPNEEAFAGGLNLQLKEGLYYNLRVLDVSSLYPFMVMLYNISFDRICCNCCKDDPAAQVPKEVLVDADGNPLPGRNYWICQKQGEGVFAAKMREFWKKRAEYKQLWRKANNEGSFDLAKIYEVKQLAYKVLMNGGFGCFGNEYFHYRDMRVSELITAYGRYILKQLCAMAIKKYGFEIASGDTDSIFVLNKGPDNNNLIEQFIEECAQRFKSRKEGDDLKLIIEDDRTYTKILLAAHKNYVGLTTNSPKPDIKGMTGNKRSMPLWGREVFNGVVQDFFGKPDVIEDPRPRIKQAIEELEAGKVPLYKLKKWERLDKDPPDYKNEKDPKKIFGLRDDLEEDDKIWYYLADNTKTEDKVSFTENPAEINLSKYKEYLYTAVEPFLRALGDTEEDINALLKIEKQKTEKRRKRKQQPTTTAVVNLEQKNEEAEEEDLDN